MEYFFDYMLERISGDSDVAKPKLFFERDYRTPGLSYSLFAVTDDWLGKQDVFRSLTAGKANALNSLKFDSLTIGFEKFAKDFEKVDDCPVKIECDFSEYFKAGCRVNLASDASSSGTGFITISQLVIRKEWFYDKKRERGREVLLRGQFEDAQARGVQTEEEKRQAHLLLVVQKRER